MRNKIYIFFFLFVIMLPIVSMAGISILEDEESISIAEVMPEEEEEETDICIELDLLHQLNNSVQVNISLSSQKDLIYSFLAAFTKNHYSSLKTPPPEYCI